MEHEGRRLDQEIKRLERQLEQAIDTERRRRIQAAINQLRAKKRNWERPH